MTSDEIIELANKKDISVENLIAYYCPSEFGYTENNPDMPLWDCCAMHDDLHCALCWGRAVKE